MPTGFDPQRFRQALDEAGAQALAQARGVDPQASQGAVSSSQGGRPREPNAETNAATKRASIAQIAAGGIGLLAGALGGQGGLAFGSGLAQGVQQGSLSVVEMARQAEQARNARVERRMQFARQLAMQNPALFGTGPGALTPEQQRPYLQAMAEPIAEFTNQGSTSPGSPAYTTAQQTLQAMALQAANKPINPQTSLEGARLALSVGDTGLAQQFLTMIRPDLVLSPEDQAAISPAKLAALTMNAEFITPESRVAFLESAAGGQPDIGLLEVQPPPGAEKSWKEQRLAEAWSDIVSGKLEADSPSSMINRLVLMKELGQAPEGMTQEDALKIYLGATSSMAQMAAFMKDDPATPKVNEQMEFFNNSFDVFKTVISPENQDEVFGRLGVDLSPAMQQGVLMEQFQQELMKKSPAGRQALSNRNAERIRRENPNATPEQIRELLKQANAQMGL